MLEVLLVSLTITGNSMKGYAKIARPLHELTSGENAKRKLRPVEWD